MCKLILFGLIVLPAFGQSFSVGLKAGIPLITAYSTEQSGNFSADAYDRLFIVGPTAEIHLPFHFSLEVDALYRRSGFAYSFAGFGAGGPSYIPPSVSKTAVNDWQFPVLGKYEMKLLPIRPFVDGGIVYHHVSASNTAAVGLDNPNTTGVAIGAGLSIKALLIRLSPEIRYTHWFTPPFNNKDLVIQSSTNQADFLLGITF